MGPVHRIVRLATEAVSAPSPAVALRTLRELRHELDEFERRQVARALADGASFAAIARDVGLSRQAVHRRFRDLAARGGEPLRATADVRLVLRYAREESQALAADTVGGAHILLGVLRATDLPSAVVLRNAGATLQRARTQVEASSSRAPLFRHELDARDLRALLAAPAREARIRGSGEIDVEHLLLGTLNDDAGAAARTLRALGVDLDTVRVGLEAILVVKRGGAGIDSAH
jgi:transposase-like protein